MVHEQAALVFTLPFNLRAANESQGGPPYLRFNLYFISLLIPLGGAYPHPDTDVANYFLQSTTRENVRCRFAVFFKHLFSMVQEEVSRLGKPLALEETCFAVTWRTHLDSHRSRLYKEIVAKSQVRLIS